MKSELQIIIWKFILAYKKQTGERLSYVNLVRDDQYREDILQQARNRPDSSLTELADQVELGLDGDLEDVEDFEDQSESILLAEAPDEAWSSSLGAPLLAQEEKPARKTQAREIAPKQPIERYAYRLHEIYQRDNISLLHRRALDRFRRKNAIDVKLAMDTENQVRAKLGMTPQDWKQELQVVIDDVKDDGNTLSLIRNSLYQAYVQPTRLNDDEFDAIYSGRNGGPAPLDRNPGTGRRWLVIGVFALIIAVLISQI